MNKTNRILTELIVGATLIGTALTYKDEIREYLNPNSASYQKYAQDTTKKINEQLEAKLVQNENFLNLPKDYRANAISLNKYKTWIEKTVEESEKNESYAIIIDKAAYSLQLFKNGEKITEFPIELGRNPIDDKFMESDLATPEGRYNIAKVKNAGQTHFHKAYLINYPTQTDKQEFTELKERNIIEKGNSAGSFIEIHGNGSTGENKRNWTWGCIALSNENIDKLFSYNLGEKTPITIVRYGTKNKY